jgi:hypothetical protein
MRKTTLIFIIKILGITGWVVLLFISCPVALCLFFILIENNLSQRLRGRR